LHFKKRSPLRRVILILGLKVKEALLQEDRLFFLSLSAQGKKAKVKTLMSHSKVMVAVNCIKAPHLPRKTRSYLVMQAIKTARRQQLCCGGKGAQTAAKQPLYSSKDFKGERGPACAGPYKETCLVQKLCVHKQEG